MIYSTISKFREQFSFLITNVFNGFVFVYRCDYGNYIMFPN